jgi:peptidoglycan hydrolase-like protein with peptidoglycan-binding domain/predicted chitinase
MSDGHGRSTEGFGISREQSIELIVRTCLDNGVTNPRQIAYILATAQHETRNFSAPEEDFGRAQARKLGYQGGEEYFGRGYVHLTHRDNYEALDRRLGLDGALIRDPGRAAEPDVAAKILVIGMRDGLFTGRRLDRYIDEDSSDLYNARRTVNGVVPSKPWSVKAAHECERFSQAWEQQVPDLIEVARRHEVTPSTQLTDTGSSALSDGQLMRGERGPEVARLQRRLNALGYWDAGGVRLVEDGDFGEKTRNAVAAFQRDKAIERTGVAGRETLAALSRAGDPRYIAPAPDAAPTLHERVPINSGAGAASIYLEAERHFLSLGNRFEYGRPDVSMRNEPGNRRTDGSRNERDLDGDGLKGVDCSAFVWRGLRNAGYAVPATPFTTRTLFEGRQATAYAREHFDVVSAAEARRDSGELQRGDILLFKQRGSPTQHVGIFKDYDANGRIQFIGSQVSTGPAQAGAGEGSYWNGRNFEIVGALRAKPEFQVRTPLHADGLEPAARTGPAARVSQTDAPLGSPSAVKRAADADGILQPGENGPAVAVLQRRLADLGYRGADGRPLAIDGDFGRNTRGALVASQREHGLEGRGVAGPKTAGALERAEQALMSHPAHPQYPLYSQVLDRVHAEERARGQASGHHSQRIAAALAVECLREGIDRVDRVELNRDVSLVRGVQVGALRDEPGLNRVTDGISVPQAARQTLLESSEQMQQVAANRRAQQVDQHQLHARPVPALTH